MKSFGALKAGVGTIVFLSIILLNIVCLYIKSFLFAVHISKLNNQVENIKAASISKSGYIYTLSLLTHKS